MRVCTVLLRSLFWPAALAALASCTPGEPLADPGGLGVKHQALNGSPDGGAGCTSTGQPEIQPDKEDYYPPETVTLIATGLECGAPYSVRLTTPTQYWPVYVAGGQIINLPTRSADASGTAVFTYELLQEYSGNFPVELLDGSGQVVATTEFHDSHFRYGTISWVQDPITAKKANFTITTSWRRTYLSPLPNVGSTFLMSSVGPTFNFGDATASGNPTFTVTQIDVANDWFVAVATLPHTYTGNGPYTAGFQSCCRLSTLANNGNTVVHDGNFQAQTTVRFDVQEAPPVSSLQPIVTAPKDAPGFQFTIPRTDNDGDVTTCRFATCLEAYLDATANCVAAPTGMTINPSTCVVSFSTVGKAVNSLFTAQVMIEDHRTINNVDTVLTKVPVDFILQIIAPNANPPVCTLNNFAPAPTTSTASTASWSVAPNTAIAFRVNGADADVADVIKIDTGSLPIGATMNPALPVTGVSPRNSTFAWTPTVANAGNSYVVNYTVTDPVGQQASCVATINVIGRPIVTVPANLTIEATSAAGATVPYSATAKDSGGGNLTPTCVPSSGALFPIGTTTVNCSATDASGQTGTASFTVTVRDTTPPTISCPSDISTACTGSSSATVNVPNATATDACSVPTVSGPAGSASYPLGTTSLTFTAKDPSNNQATCQSTVTIFDNLAPTISCPAAINAECTSGHGASVNVPNATASDTCSSATVTGPAGTASYAIGTTGLAFTATDSSGNQVSCASSVTVSDTTPPSITCPAPQAAECTGSGVATVDVPNATGSDLCGNVAITGPAGSAAYPLGTTGISFNATDDAGRTAGCATSVAVVDTTKPSITCPGAITAECTGNQAASVNVPNATASDTCTTATVAGPAGTATYAIGTTALTFTATDASGNQVSCGSSVTVRDTTSPSISCPAAITAECTGNHAASVNVANATASDTCATATVAGPAGAASYPIGTTALPFTATDASGNHANCGSSVTVVDTTPPSISCPAAISAECTGSGVATVNVPNATGGDLCGGVAITGPAGSAAYPLGTTGISFNATDDAGRTAGCATSVAVVDTTNPSITCPGAITAECTGNHAAAVNVANATASDICTTATVAGPAGTATYTIGTTALPFTATDASGNQVQCSSSVTVVDTTPPSISCPAAISAECTGSGVATVNVPNATGSDLCGGVAITGPAGSAAYPLGTTGISFSAADDAGKTAGCASSVTVRDTTPPVFNPATLVPQVVLGNCAGSALAFTAPKANDLCQSVTVACDPLPGNSFGANLVHCVATDGSGNQASANLTVNVVQPMRLAFLSPLEDDNVADNILTDADVTNLFQVKQTIPNQIKVYACNGTDVTTSIAGAVTLRLTINYRSDASVGMGTSIVPNYSGVGDAGGQLVLTGSHFHYNQKTDPANYPAGTINTSNYFDNIITLTYNSAPGIVAGQEDARLESK